MSKWHGDIAHASYREMRQYRSAGQIIARRLSRSLFRMLHRDIASHYRAVVRAPRCGPPSRFEVYASSHVSPVVPVAADARREIMPSIARLMSRE